MMQRFLKITGFLFLLFTFSPVDAQIPTPEISIGGTLQDVIIDGDIALVAEGETIVRIALSNYQPTDRLSLGQKIIGLQLHPYGLYALTEKGVFAISRDGKEVLNFVPGGGQSMSITGNWLTIAAEEGGVRLRAIQPDGQLTGTWQIDTPGRDWQAAITENNLLVTADGGVGIRFYDIGNNLAGISALPEPAPAVKIVAAGTTLFAMDNQSHIYAISAENPAHPVITGHYAPVRDAHRAILSDSWLIIADATDGLKIYDAQTLRYVNGEINLPALDVQKVNNWIVAARTGGLHIYDANRLPSLNEIAFIPLWATPTALAARPMENQVVAALGSDGLVVVTLNSFRTLAALTVRGTITDIEIQNTLAYITLNDGRFLILDMANFNAPQVISISETGGFPQAIHLNSNLAVISSGEAGFYLFDVTDPYQPQRLALIPAQNFAQDGLQLPEGNLLLLDGQILRVFSTQENIFTEFTSYETPGSKTLAAGGQRVITAGNNHIASFSAFGGIPTLLTTYTAPVDISDMQIDNNALFLSSQTPEAALVRLDVSNPAHLRESAIYEIPEGIEKFALQNDDLLAINSTLSHWKLNPYGATFVGQYQPPGEVTALHIEEQNIYFLSQLSHQSDGENFIVLNIPATAIAQSGETYAVINPENDLMIYQAGIPVATEKKATALTASEKGFWFSEPGGNIFFIALGTLQPELEMAFRGNITALTWHDEKLYIGTRDGQALVWQNDAMVSQTEVIGEVHNLYVLSDGRIAVAADDLWIFEADLSTGQYVQMPDKVLAVAENEETLAIANGSCGLRLLSYPGLQETGLYPMGYVYDVAYADNQWWVIESGIAKAVDLTALPESAPFHPEVIENASFLQFRWQPVNTACAPVRYEISINGERLLVNVPEFILNKPIQNDIQWQVTLIDSAGKRITGPSWSVHADYNGWTHKPQRFSDRLDTQDYNFPWLLLGILMIALGVMGLSGLVRYLLEMQQGA